MVTRLAWNAPDKRFFEAGCDRGVFYPKVGSAVAWNGLVGVDEASTDSAVEYYLDGRPYLYFPQPKEYSATLRAYTYPDAFAEVMGLAEVSSVDGMYLDSQIGDSFGLSYRTLVGNALDPNPKDYKIHLVYNATVALQGASYSSLSSSINPSEFSWEIKATPVPVSGYRPTAHIVIDTRHMDEINIAKIESMIYGDDVTTPSLPDPTTLVELLTFGTTITITDEGDGTWTARGSYEQIYMVDGQDGIFQIDGVDYLDHGDGTFDINTTTT